MNAFKHLLYPAVLLSTAHACLVASETVPLATVELLNAAPVNRPTVVVRIPMADLGVNVAAPDRERLGVWEDGIPVPSSLSACGGELLVSASLASGASQTLMVGLAPEGAGLARVEIGRTNAEISHKANGYWKDNEYIGGEFNNVTATTTPPEHTDHSWYYRYEGPGWENDKVGYRLYLDWRNGIDVFGKKVTGMVLHDVGQDGFDSYHEPADWGMDILKVGSALGIGGFGHWDGEKAVRVSEVDSVTCRILRNDGLVSAFSNDYQNWNFGNGTTDLEASFEIEAGTYLTEVALRTDGDRPRIVTGLPIHEGIEVFRGATADGDVTVPNSGWSFLATYGDQSLDGEKLGMVVFFQGGRFKEFLEDEHNLLVRLSPREGKVNYRFGALWGASAPEAASREAFLDYIKETLEVLNKPLRVTVNSAVREALLAQNPPSEDPLYWGARLAESVVQRRGDSLSHGSVDPRTGGHARWSYTTGLMAKALYEIGDRSGNVVVRDFGLQTISSFIGEDGTIHTYRLEEYNIDKINSGKMLLELYVRTGEKRYAIAAKHLLKQLETHPRTSGGAFWHKKIYPWQVWLDGVYMAAPFLARSAIIFEEPHLREETLAEFRIVRSTLRDPATGLYYHGWDESREQSWADSETGLSAEFWGRGLGWYAMALVDCLDYMDADPEGKAYLIETVQELAAALVDFQDPATGVWWQVMNRPGETGNYREASASSMFTYMLAKGINAGYLPDSYLPVVEKAWDGMVREFIENDANGLVSLRNICLVAGLGFGRDGTLDYYASEPVVKNDSKGVGPFLMAAIEVSQALAD
ncbi:MAG: glycoside hydrolase family 88 protein [Puniceicoccaceae bacterium]